jgi:hypothetical protein
LLALYIYFDRLNESQNLNASAGGLLDEERGGGFEVAVKSFIIMYAEDIL